MFKLSRAIWTSLFTLLVLTTSPGIAQIIRVDKHAPGTSLETGDSWQNAYHELSDALNDILTLAVPATQVWVANGVYEPQSFPTWDGSGGTVERYKTFQIPSKLAVYGGFRGYDPNDPLNGGEHDLADRAGLFQRTILSGDQDGDPESSYGNVFTVVSIGTPFGTETDVRLDGFRIEFGNSNAQGGFGDDRRGGGLRAFYVTDLVLANCTFRNNRAREGGGAYVFGGNCQVKHCAFENNTARDMGGGARLEILSSTASNPSGIFNTMFSMNTCLSASADIDIHGHGGGLYVGNPAGDLTLCNLLIYNNVGSLGAGVYVDTVFSGPKTIWTNCTLAYNQARSVGLPGKSFGTGGGLFLRSGSTIHSFRNMILWKNLAQTAALDIAVMSGMTDATVDFSIVQTGTVSAWGGNNLIQNPMFVSDSGRNLRLADGSPAIDSGDNSALPADIADVDEDMDFTEEVPWSLAKNNIRKTDDPDVPGGTRANPIVDRGAHERLGVMPIR